nr:TonB-dependent receptor [Polymorphobacter glacialis]
MPRGAFYGLVDRDFRETRVDNITARAEHDFGGVTLRNTSRYGRSEQNYIWTQPDNQQGNVYGTDAAVPATAGGQVWRRINSRYGYAEGLINQTDLFGTFATGSFRHSFAASAEFSTERARNGAYVSNPQLGTAISTGSTIVPRCTPAMLARYNCTSAANPNPNDPWASYASDTSSALAPIQKSLAQTQTWTDTSTRAGSLFDTITITDELLINLGGRFDNYKTKVSPGLAATSTAMRSTFKRDDDIWTYQAGIIYKPIPNASLYASTSTAATPPGAFLAQGQESNALNTTSQSITDALQIERTTSYEIGGKIDLFEGQLALTLAGFRTRTQNARTTVENGVVAYIGKRRINGVEFGANGNITPEWNVFGGYTYMDANIVDGGITTTTVNGVAYFAPSVNTGKQFPNTPKHSLTAFTNYKVTPALTLGGGAIYMSKVYGGYSDTRVVTNGAVVVTRELARIAPAYWRFDANAAFAVTDRIQLQANVLNVANKRYFDRAYSAHYANQAAGRTAILSLNVNY